MGIAGGYSNPVWGILGCFVRRFNFGNLPATCHAMMSFGEAQSPFDVCSSTDLKGMRYAMQTVYNILGGRVCRNQFSALFAGFLAV